MIHISHFPQLTLIAWNRCKNDVIEETEAFALYERNWRYIDQENLEPDERHLIDRLIKQYGHGVLNV